VTASNLMAKPRATSSVTLTYPATTAYKQWVWKRIRERWPKGALQAFVDELKRKARAELIELGKLETISTATISDFLGPEGSVPPPTNSALLPAFNKVLGIEPPPVCDPSDEMQQLVERFKRAWSRATPRERSVLLAALGSEDDQGPVDGDRPGAGRGALRSI
jgi:hypothetical protein